MRRSILIFVLLALLLTACSGGGLSDEESAAQSVENYLQALVDKEGERVLTLSCADWEASAAVEVDSLEAVETHLEDLSCESTGTDGDYMLVSCAGTLVMSYQGEDRPLDLSAKTYQLIESGGEWLVCGYHE